MPMTPLPTPPSISDPANFAARADAFCAALLLFQTEANALSSTAVTLSGGAMIATLGFCAATVGAPAAYGPSDTDTGIWWPAANTIGFTCGGAEIFRIDTTQMLLSKVVGAVVGTVGAPGIFFSGDTNTGMWGPVGGDIIAFSVGGLELLNLSAGLIVAKTALTVGAIGFGLLNSGGQSNGLKITGTAFTPVNAILANQVYLDAAATNGILINTSAATPIYFATNSALAMRIDSSQILRFEAASCIANGTVATVLGSLGPTGSATTVKKWLKMRDNAGGDLYIPCF